MRILPVARPVVVPEISLLPGMPHFYQGVRDLAELHNWLYCKDGLQHVGQRFGQLLTSGRSMCTRSTAGSLKVLEYLFVPRAGMACIEFDALFASDAGGTIQVYCPDSLQTATVPVAAGASVQVGGIVEIDRPWMLSHLEILLSCDGTYLDLNGFSFWDADLTDGDLP